MLQPSSPASRSRVCKPLFQYAGFECLKSRHVLEIALGFSHALLLVQSFNGETFLSNPRSSDNQSVVASNSIATINVWSFGSNKFGQCGISPPSTSSSSSSPSPSSANFYIPPTIIPFSFTDEPIRQLSCGDKHSLVLVESGKLYSFGSTQHGLLGRSVSDAERASGMSFQPQQIESNQAITKVSAAATHSLFTCSDGSCYSFGLGLYGALGHDDMVTRELPQRIEALEGLRVAQVAAGVWHSLFLTDQGAVYSCGSNAQGQLGRVKEEAEFDTEGTAAKAMDTSSSRTVVCTASYSPQVVFIAELEEIEDEWIVSIAAGAHHSLCVSNKHRVRQMGNVQLYESPTFLAAEIDHSTSKSTFEQRATPTLVPLDYYSSPLHRSATSEIERNSNNNNDDNSDNQENSSRQTKTASVQVACSPMASYLLANQFATQ